MIRSESVTIICINVKVCTVEDDMNVRDYWFLILNNQTSLANVGTKL